MLGIGKNMGILLLSITVILSAATFLTTQTLDKSTNDVGFLMGHMTLKVIDENGYVKDYRQTDNVIVIGGWDALVENAFEGDFLFDPDGSEDVGSLNATAPGAFSHIGIGSDSTTAINIDTALKSELTGCPRSTLGIVADNATNAAGSSSITVSLFGGFNEPADIDCQGTAINEAGLFNGTQAQNTAMFARNTFSTVPALGSFDFLEIDWDFTFSSGQ